MKELFSFKENDKGTRFGNTFARPNVDSVKKGDRSLRSFGPIVWNVLLPENLENCGSLDDFKNKTSLLEKGLADSRRIKVGK